ncbi:MAG: nucleotidyltransferase family protein [Bacteroidetes bacterium]|nr:nucleotidyltransferase family protein [Bacteroidota bacterium]
MRTGILILAAGSASRMQQPKMLLPFGKANILSHLLDEARALEPAAICLVTGYYHDEILSVVVTEGVQVVRNEQWQEGMSGSIRLGLLQLLQQESAMQQLIILVSDQPFLTRSLLHNMLQVQQETQKGIIAAGYAEIQGTPVLFTKEYFDQLKQLTGDKGAKPILQTHSGDVAVVDFPEGEKDIDTPEDYSKYCTSIK